jgi:hypothetical protein
MVSYMVYYQDRRNMRENRRIKENVANEGGSKT